MLQFLSLNLFGKSPLDMALSRIPTTSESAGNGNRLIMLRKRRDSPRVLYTMRRELGRAAMILENPLAGEEGQKAVRYARILLIALAGRFTAGFFLSKAYSAGLCIFASTTAMLVRVAAPTLCSNASVGPAWGGPPTLIAAKKY